MSATNPSAQVRAFFHASCAAVMNADKGMCVQVSSSSPTTVQDILCAYSQSEQADKEVLLAVLKAKTAEDQV